MFHEYRDDIAKLKVSNPHFARIFDEHNELDDKIKELESGGGEYADSFEIERMKKEKLKLKDEVYAMILESRKS